MNGQNAPAHEAASKSAAPPFASMPPLGPTSSLEAFRTIVDRLEFIVDAESDTLNRHLPLDVAELSHRKRQGMLELGRVMRVLNEAGAQDEVRERLGQFAVKLEHNRYTLEIHLRAVREVADIIAKSMKEAESDGTYSLRIGRQ